MVYLWEELYSVRNDFSIDQWISLVPTFFCWSQYLRSTGLCFNMEGERDSSLVEQFVNITGASESRAQVLLNACSGNLEMAIGMHLEEEEPSGNHTQGESTSHQCVGWVKFHVSIPVGLGLVVQITLRT